MKKKEIGERGYRTGKKEKEDIKKRKGNRRNSISGMTAAKQEYGRKGSR